MLRFISSTTGIDWFTLYKLIFISEFLDGSIRQFDSLNLQERQIPKSIDLDQTAPQEQSDLGLHCLPKKKNAHFAFSIFMILHVFHTSIIYSHIHLIYLIYSSCDYDQCKF